MAFSLSKRADLYNVRIGKTKASVFDATN